MRTLHAVRRLLVVLCSICARALPLRPACVPATRMLDSIRPAHVSVLNVASIAFSDFLRAEGPSSYRYRDDREDLQDIFRSSSSMKITDLLPSNLLELGLKPAHHEIDG